MESSGQIDKVHVSLFEWPPKAKKSSKNFPCINESIVVARSGRLYPKASLPLLPDMAEMAMLLLAGGSGGASVAIVDDARMAPNSLYCRGMGPFPSVYL